MSQVGDYYVYALLRADGVTPFYIGKGRGGRAREHATPSRLRGKSLKNSIARKIISEIGHLPYAVIQDRLDEADAFEVEAGLITLLGRRNTTGGYLANLTNGGEGASGYKKTSEQRMRATEAALKPETRAAKSASLKATYTNAERRAINNAAIAAAHARPETKAKKSAAGFARWTSEAERMAQAERSRKALADPEVRRRISEGTRAAWARRKAARAAAE